MHNTPKIIHVSSPYSNSGKTRLIQKLISVGKSKGFKVATLKHSHHSLGEDKQGSDTHKHSLAGASTTIFAASDGVTIRGDLSLQTSVTQLISLITSDIDLVIIEGWKNAHLPGVRLSEPTLENPYIVYENRAVEDITDQDIDELFNLALLKFSLWVKRPREATAALLCGGNSSRMGEDKSTLDIQGVSARDKLFTTLSECCTDVIAAGCKAWNQSVIAYLDLPSLRGEGPLAGILSGLDHSTHEHVLIWSVDTPLLRPSVAMKLLDIMHNVNCDAVIPVINGRNSPLTSVWHKRTLSKLQNYLDQGERSVNRFISTLDNVLYISESTFLKLDPQSVSFASANTPEELVSLRKLYE